MSWSPSSARPDVVDLRAPAQPATEAGAALYEPLRALAARIDELWATALRSDGEHAIALGQASHGVHRALIALEELADDVWGSQLAG